MDGVICSLHTTKTQEEEEVESDLKREEDALSSDKPYELKEKIDDVASMPLEGPQEKPTTTKEGMPSGTTANNIPMEQG